VTGHGATTVFEDRDAVLVVPVVYDPGQDVDVASARDRLEEVAGHELASPCDARLGEEISGGSDYAGPVEQDAARRRCGSEDRGEERARPAPHIDDRATR